MTCKRTILCVDDHEQSLSVQKVLLETRGYRVLACKTAEEALQIFEGGGVDLVLSDVILPGEYGTELARRVKQRSPETPVILFSGQLRGFQVEAPANLFLPKGTFTPVELLERIRQLLVKRRGPRRATISAVASRAHAC